MNASLTSDSGKRDTGLRPVALITGGSRGIGRAIAIRLASDGHDCIVHYRRDEAAAASAVAELEKLGAQAWAFPAELENVDELDRLAGEIRSRAGRLDVLVANAAATTFRPLLSLRPTHVDRTLATVLRSFVLLSQHAVAMMPAGGRIVAVSGADAHYVQDGHGLLGAAKAALEVLVKYLAVEVGARGITVNAVNPGYVGTDSALAYLGEAHDRILAKIKEYTPGGEPVTPQDVADMVAYLVRPESRFITGLVLNADAGLALQGGPWAELRTRGAAGERS